MAASGVSALLGFARVVVAAHYFGTSVEMDAFLNASTLPMILFEIVNAALVAALVPTFVEYASSSPREHSIRRLGGTVINVLFIVTAAIALVGWLFAPLYVPIIAHGFPQSEQNLVLEMVRWLVPGIVATSVSAACTAVLNAHHRFLASALVWVAASVTTIVVVVTLHRQLGIFALVLGTVLGMFAQLLMQVPSILRLGMYRFELDLRHPGLVTTWAVLVPLAICSGVFQVNNAFDRYFASTLSAGSTAALDYVMRLIYLPISIAAGAIATVIFPLLARQFAVGDRDGIRRSISLALRMVTFLAIPAAAGFSALAYPIVQTLFERGAFGPDATARCASLLPFACVPLIATSYTFILVRACYACQAVRPAVIASCIAVGLNIVLSATWLPTLGARGLLLANGIAGICLSGFLIALFSRLIGGFDWRQLLTSLFRILLASLAMTGAIFLIRSSGFVPSMSIISRGSYLAAIGATAIAVFVGSARLLNVEELSIVTTSLLRKLSRRATSSKPMTNARIS